MWFELGAVPQYYPLVHTTFWVEYHLWALAPLGYHLTNVLLHAASAILLWRLLLRLKVPGAFLAAAIFAVHPVEVESVAWITERKNVLSLALALASLLCYLRFAPVEGADERLTAARAWPWFTLSLALFAAALLSKTVVATLPAVILTICWWKRGRITARDAAPLAPFFALGIALGLVTVWMERHHVGATGKEWDFTPLDRLLIAGRALWFYAGKLAWPTPLVFFYPRWTIASSAWWQYLYPAAAIATIIALWLLRARIGRGPLAAVLIFAGVLVPALGVFNVFPFRYSFVADHFQYHASIALITLAAAVAASAAELLPTRMKLVSGAAGWAAVGALALVAHERTKIYHDSEVLYNDTILGNPSGPAAYANLGAYLDSVGRSTEALALARKALPLFPEDAAIHKNYGAALLRLGKRDGFRPGQLEELLAHLDKAVELEPDDLGARNNLGFAMIAANRPQNAVAQFQHVLRADLHNADALVGLGTAQSALGDRAAARNSFAAAIREDPDRAEAHYGLGMVLADSGALDEGIDQLKQALEHDPANADALYALAGAVARSGDLRHAADYYRAALERRPHFPRALNNLGIVLINAGNVDEAVGYFEEASRQDPEYADAKANLEKALTAQRQREADSPQHPDSPR
jgi:tetratricopeptide (TPR) repeat protein